MNTVFIVFRVLLFNIFLKLKFRSRIKLNGLIKPEGKVLVSIEKGGRLLINGNVTFRSNCQVLVRNGAKCSIGTNSFFNRNCSIVCRKKVLIGSETLFGEGVKIYDNDHEVINGVPQRASFNCEEVTIGSNVWIANDVNILRGSHIPNCSVIGAMSLVNAKLPLTGVYVGIPAKLIKEHD